MDRVKLGNIEENKENEKVKRKKNSTIYFKSNKSDGSRKTFVAYESCLLSHDIIRPFLNTKW